MPRGVYDRGKGKAIVHDHEWLAAEKERVTAELKRQQQERAVRRCDRCEAFEPGQQHEGNVGRCLLNPEPVHKYGHMWCLQWRAKA